jgi:hypothetical protein
MKKIFTKGLLLLCCVLLSSSLLKAQLLTEDFNFTGTLTSNGWTAHSAGGTTPISTTTGLTYTGLAGSGVGNAALVNNLGGEDINRTFTAQSTDGQSVYVSMLVNINDAATAKAGDYFFNIGDGGGAAFTLFSARLFAKITTSTVNFGISNTSTATYGTTAFAKNTTYLLIIKYTISVAGNDPVALWVIPSGVPATEAAAGTPEVLNTATAGQNSIQGVALRQGSSTNSVSTIVDAIRIGATWADVTGSSTVPPSLTVTGTINDFGNVAVGSSSASQSYNISGANLTGAPGVITVTAPTDFEVSNNNTTWAASTTIAYTTATLAATPVWVRFTPQTTGPKTGNVANTGGGVTTAVNVAVSGNAIAPATPVLSATTLTAFPATCINTTAGPNSFTINGVNLSTADITVGPLAGYSFSTTAGGTYTASLTLTQPGGNYSQTVFVNFTPTAVQSYNGNIVVAGAGASSINVAAVGSGNNNTPTAVTGTASNITTTSATLSSSISNTGCTAVTVYGVEYSTTSGFANGTGTAVAGTNLAGGNYSVNISALTPNTQYYYKAYATNAGGTAYGAQQTFRTATPVITATPLTAFGSLCVNATGGPNSFTLTSTGLSAANVTVGPLAGYTFSTTSGGTYTSSLSLTQPGGPFTQIVFVKFTPTAVQSYNGSIPVGGGGANTINVSVSGAGVNSPATLTTGAVSNISTQSATIAGTLNSAGCSLVTQYGIEYSGINNFPTGSGMRVPGSNMDAGGAYSVNLNGLVPGTVYYYRAYAISGAGAGYGTQQSFTTDSLNNGLVVYGIPVAKGGQIRISLKSITPDHYGIKLYNMMGQLVFRKDIIVQLNFIDITFNVPGQLPSGMYLLELESTNGRKEKQAIMIK